MNFVETPKVDITKYIKDKFEDAEFNKDGSCKQYTSVIDEYNAVKHGVAVRNISDSVFLELFGNDCKGFLNRITTKELCNIQPDKATKTLFCNSFGGVLDEVVLLPINDYHLLVRSRDDKKKIKRWIDNYIVGEDVKVKEEENKYSLFELYGPQALTYLSILCGDGVEKIEELKIRKFLVDDFEINVIKFCDGVEKYWILIKDKGLDEVFNLLEENKSVLDVAFLGEEAFKSFRIENGISVYPSEYNGKFSPFDLKIKNLIDESKKGYLGYEKIVPYLSGDNSVSKLCLVEFNIEDKIELPYIIKSKENQIGIITSEVNSVKYKTRVAMAVIESDVESFFINHYECKILKEF
ncbi:MAG: hypothetical protein JEY94_02380 [Melioribacteraceae bacterium]|nr:hypothetical protein [Melioribacteraceae bacterium]